MKAEIVTNGGEGGRLAKELCDALGLKHVRNLIIQMPRNGLFTVTAEFYPEIDGVKQMTTILKKFRLEEIKDKWQEKLESLN